jgi:hypothetical protein
MSGALRLLGTMVAALSLAGFASAQPGAADRTAAPTIDLSVTSFGTLDALEMLVAKHTTETLLAIAGIRLSWSEREEFLDCSTGIRRAFVPVKLLPHRSQLERQKTGLVARDPDTEAPMVLIYVPSARDIVSQAKHRSEGRAHPALFGLEIGHVVGLAIAHELGHVLGLAHASRGVMKAHPDITDVIALRSSRLAFEPREIEIIRRRLTDLRQPSGCTDSPRRLR